MKLNISHLVFFTLLLCTQSYGKGSANKQPALVSIDTGYTISKVRSGNNKADGYIVASTYTGDIIALDYRGNKLWHTALSGYMNHDLWTADLTHDGVDEILAANADGHVYCLSAQGKLLWSFKPNEAPMYAVTVLHHENQAYVVAGGYHNNFYYLDAQGKLIKEIKSTSYSNIKPWYKKSKAHGNQRERFPKDKRHITNFLRPAQLNGEQILAIHAAANSMQSSGMLYFFKPLANQPFLEKDLKPSKTPKGDMRIRDIDGDGNDEIILGSTKMKGQNLFIYSPTKKKHVDLPLGRIDKRFLTFGYRITQAELINDRGQPRLFILYGNSAATLSTSLPHNKVDVFTGKYSFNDMWLDNHKGKIILASSQSGGSCIHLLDTQQKNWQRALVELEPPGNIAAILKNTSATVHQLEKYKASSSKRKPRTVYLMSDYKAGSSPAVINTMKKNYVSPIFLNYGNLGTEKWDRSVIDNETYRNKRDKRQKYNLSQQTILKKAKKLYSELPGAAYWGGHGNDPYYRSLDTHRQTLKLANGKKTVMIFPEMAHYDADFEATLRDFFFPLAEASQKNNAHIFMRNKHTFWQSHIYKAGWSRLLSGEFADVFVPAMEETTDKSMELSLASRSGLWASGAINNWGTRFSRDNTSFDRLRQHSHQMIPNHALRQFVYHIANGATFINNFRVDNDYLSVLWDLIGKGVLFVPHPHEIVSYSPVNLAMLPPEGLYEDEGNNVKWLTLYDPKIESENKMVFSRLNGSWPGAPVTEWDFSRYAAGVKDRRLNFLPPYPNGMVLMTPPQQGVHADHKAPRGKLVSHLHPLYKNILAEFYTDGHSYYSADGETRYPAEKYYSVVAQTIKEKAKLLPITVSGELSWVVAQTSPTNLRLTLVDGGYINPKSATAEVSFNTIIPTEVKDILTNEKFKLKNGKTFIKIPTGLFRFIDVELSQPL